MVLFAVLLPPWLYLSPVYKQAAERTANAFLDLAFEGGKKSLTYDKEHDQFVVQHTDMKGGGRPAFGAEVIHYNMVILAALILASPGLTLRRKARRLLGACFFLYVIHAVELVVKTEFIFATQMGNYSDIHYANTRVLWGFADYFFEVFGPQVLPFILWALCCAPAVLEYLGSGASGRKEGKKG